MPKKIGKWDKPLQLPYLRCRVREHSTHCAPIKKTKQKDSTHYASRWVVTPPSAFHPCLFRESGPYVLHPNSRPFEIRTEKEGYVFFSFKISIM